MMKKLLFSTIALVFFASSFGQGSLWKATSAAKLQALPKMDRSSFATEYELYSLDLAALKTQLAAAPSRESGQQSNVVISFPAPDGQIVNYRIYEASVMHPELAAKFPNSKSYVGQSVDGLAQTIRFSITMYGLHTMTFGADGISYIDPFTKDGNHYIVYNKSKLHTSISRECHVEDAVEEIDLGRNTANALTSDGMFRTYRLAMASTVEYSAYHINAAGLNGGTLAQKKQAVQDAMIVTLTRINGVYERDLAVTMQFVANNDLLIFVDNDNFDNENFENALLNQSHTTIVSIIGNAAFDIGHTVSTGGGGVAALGSVCNTSNKGRGITGSAAPVGDAYDIDFVAHEIGHQFGGRHTFNGIGGNCTNTGDNPSRSNATAVEPGSGTTIMAYAGICGIQDVQGNSDAYFHAVSIAEIVAHITGPGSCGVNTPNNNQAPVADAGADYTIPKGTAFVLRGSATDADDDLLTYTWEQLDNEVQGFQFTVAQPPLPTNTGGPNYRSVAPSPSPNRYMPQLSSVVAGNLTPKWEVTSNVARTFDFALTVRDNRATNGGQTGRDNKVVVVNATAGPFTVTSQNAASQVMAPNSQQTVTWNVAGTTGNGVNTSHVNILLSTDNGQTFTTTLAINTPNDGSETITLPDVVAANCRIMVEAVGNIFYAVNGSNIAIGNYQYTPQNVCTDYTFSPNAPITESADNSYPGYQFTITDSYTISDFNFYANVTHPVIGQFNLLIMAPWQTALNTALWYNNTSCTGANMDKWFDTAGSPVNCATTNDGGNFLPFSVANINGYNGNNSAGVWRIYFKDAVVDGNNTGATVNTIKFQLCRSELVPTLATPKVGLEGFALYPNPNNGSFNVKFSSYSSNKIAISVHDIQGRKIMHQEYENTGLFNENLQLNNVQSGIYLVTVQDGDLREVKRIVIQ